MLAGTVLAIGLTVASLQVLLSASGSYLGDMRNRKTHTCRFSDFLASLNQHSTEAGTEQLYLAQAPICSGNAPDTAPLQALMADIVLPEQLREGEKLASVNLWMASRYWQHSCALRPWSYALSILTINATVSHSQGHPYSFPSF